MAKKNQTLIDEARKLYSQSIQKVPTLEEAQKSFERLVNRSVKLARKGVEQASEAFETRVERGRKLFGHARDIVTSTTWKELRKNVEKLGRAAVDVARAELATVEKLSTQVIEDVTDLVRETFADTKPTSSAN
jgi:hypothetical protein